MRPNLLFLTQLPPPLHGASLMNLRTYSSKIINESYNLYHINITTSKNLEDIQRFHLRKIGIFVKQIFGLLSRLYKKKFDLLYITLSSEGFAFYKDSLLWLIAAPFVKKRILHFHTKGIITSNQHSSLKMILIRFILSRSYIIVLSRLLEKEFYGNGKQIFILNIGIPLEPLPLKNHYLSEYLNILFLSNLSREKGVIQFLVTCGLLIEKKIKFQATIAGKDWDLNVDSVLAEIKNRNMEGFVKVIGPVYAIDKIRILTQSDILLFPTYYKKEAFPLVILEAFQFGVVPICSDEAAIPEMIEQGIDGFFFPYDKIELFANCIEDLAKDNYKLFLMKERGKIKFRDRYTFEIYEEKLVGILNDVSKRTN